MLGQPGDLVATQPAQNGSVLSVLAEAGTFLVRPARAPGRWAGDIVQVVDLADLPGRY